MENKIEKIANLFRVSTPDGSEIYIPEHVDSTTDPYFSIGEDESIRKYYHHNGYVIIRKLIPAELCDTLRSNFEKEMKPYDGYLYRQPSSGAAEKHTIS